MQEAFTNLPKISELLQRMKYLTNKKAFSKKEMFEIIDYEVIQRLCDLDELIKYYYPELVDNYDIYCHYSYEETKEYYKRVSELLVCCKNQNMFLCNDTLEEKIKTFLELADPVKPEDIDKFTYEEKRLLIIQDNYLTEKVFEKVKKIGLLNKYEFVQMFDFSSGYYYAKSHIYGKYLNKTDNPIRDEDMLTYIVENEIHYYATINLLYNYKANISEKVAKRLLERLTSPLEKEEIGNVIGAKEVYLRLLKCVNDEYKIELLKKIKVSEIRQLIVLSISDEKLQERYLLKMPLLLFSDKMADSSSDYIKEKMINPLNRNNGALIASIEDDNLKLNLLLKNKDSLDSFEKAKILYSFKDKYIVKKYITILQRDIERVDFIWYDFSDAKEYPELYELLASEIKEEKAIRKLFLYNSTISRLSNETLCTLIDKIKNQFTHADILYSLSIKELSEDKFQVLKHAATKANQASLIIAIKRILKTFHINNDIKWLINHLSCMIRLIKNEGLLINIIRKFEFFMEYNEEFDEMIIRIANYKNIDPKKLLKLCKKFGIEVIKNLESKNISTLLSMDEERLDKFLELFSTKNITLDEEDRNNALNTIFLRGFKIKYHYLCSVFVNVKHAIEENISVKDYIEYLSRIVDLKSRYGISPEELIAGLDSKDSSYLDLLHKITSEVIEEQRALYLKEEKAKYEVQNAKKKTKKELIKYLYNHLTPNIIYEEINKYVKENRKDFTSEELELIENKELLLSVLRFKKDRSGEISDKKAIRIADEIVYKVFENLVIPDVRTEFAPSVVSQERLFSILSEMDVDKFQKTVLNDKRYDALKELLESRKLLAWFSELEKTSEIGDLDLSSCTLASLFTNFKKINREISFEEIMSIAKSYNDLLNKLDEIENSNSDKEIIEEKKTELLKRVKMDKNPQFQEFVKIMRDIKNHIPDYSYEKIIIELMNAAFIYNDENMDAAKEFLDEKIVNLCKPELLQQLFNLILELNNNTKRKNAVTQGEIIDISECCDIYTNRRKMIIDPENYKLLRKNSPPNSAHAKFEARYKNALIALREMHKRTKITVPPSRDVYNLQNGKKITISVGDTHAMDNLTLGERTGACMRIGGHADDLFNICLKNENGFHIKFYNPETKKFVSRVSGFRNGNTVFLNELRFSEDENYTNEDVVEACKLISRRLIDSTTDSKYPIDNVIIANAYAMRSVKTGTPVNYKNINIKAGLGKFYSDVGAFNDILLASRNKDNTLVDIKLGPADAERYNVLREEIKETYGKNALLTANRLRLLDALYLGQSTEKVELIKENTIIYCISGQDWYIALDKEGRISRYCMKSGNDKEAMNNEMKEALKKMQYILNNQQEKDRIMCETKRDV